MSPKIDWTTFAKGTTQTGRGRSSLLKLYEFVNPTTGAKYAVWQLEYWTNIAYFPSGTGTRDIDFDVTDLVDGHRIATVAGIVMNLTNYIGYWNTPLPYIFDNGKIITGGIRNNPTGGNVIRVSCNNDAITSSTPMEFHFFYTFFQLLN